MRDGSLFPLSGEGKVVEADETYHGKIADPKPSPQRRGRPYLKRKGPSGKRAIVGLVERGGKVRMFHVGGMKGIYQHCDEKHLHRYLEEYDFRYNHRTALGVDDVSRTLAPVKGAEGKRLTYHQPNVV